MSGLLPFMGKNGLSGMFDDFERNFFGNWTAPFTNGRTDIIDKGDHFILQAELPGFEKEDISINIDGNTLVILAQRQTEKEEKGDKGEFVRRERSYGSFHRSFDISSVNADNIGAEYKNGVLELKLPKKEENIKTSRKIDIN